jgi:hypothetical protein
MFSAGKRLENLSREEKAKVREMEGAQLHVEGSIEDIKDSLKSLRRLFHQLQAPRPEKPLPPKLIKKGLRFIGDGIHALKELEENLSTLLVTEKALLDIEKVKKVPCSFCDGQGTIRERAPILQTVKCFRCNGKGFTSTGIKDPQTPEQQLNEAICKLSLDQRKLLLRLAAYQRRAGGPVPIKAIAKGKPLSRAATAARSRMLKSLENRGLVERLNRTTDMAPVRRASLVQVTALGQRAVKVLTIPQNC